MNKATGSKELYRGLGSIDIVAVARSVLVVKKLEEDSSTRVVTQIKNNLSEIGRPVAFDISQNGSITWLGNTSLENVELDKEMTKKKEKYASILLYDLLNKGPVLTSVILEEASKNNISPRTIRTVKKELKIISLKRKDGWYWTMRKDGDDE